MDKQQERALQSNGFTVFRLSGSEIASNIMACVDEVVWYVKRLWMMLVLLLMGDKNFIFVNE